jgi:hypothetical protein
MQPEERIMPGKHTRHPLLRALLVGLTATCAFGAAKAQDTSPYLVGQWKLNDVFADFAAASDISPIATRNTEFVFLNPSNRTLTLEYAFFATDDATTGKPTIFCGCDRDTLNPNGRVRYTMQGEKEGGQFSTKLCPTQTDGVMKTIVFTRTDSRGNPVTDDALQAGYQIDVAEPHTFGYRHTPAERTSSPLLAVDVDDDMRAEINAIHAACDKFIPH